MIKSLFIICVLTSGFIANAIPSVNVEKSSINYAAVKVTGKGRTFAEAMRNAKAKIPRGKSYFAVTSKKSGAYYYVTLHCRW